MQSLLLEVDDIALSLHGHLQTFGAIHVGEIIKLKNENKITEWHKRAFRKMEEMLFEVGSPADWAFTLCSLTDSVSFFLKITKESRITVFIKNFVFENYARKLRGAKRVALIASLCACVHYDTKPYRSEGILGAAETRVYKSIVDDTLDKFGVGSEKNLTDEVRIYLAFMCLITADVVKHVENNNAKCLNYIAKANLKSAANSSRFFGLWEFLILYSKMIQDDEQHEKEFQGLQECAILLPDCQGRWMKGFCAIRNGKFPDCFVNTCFKRLGISCQRC